MEEVQQRAVNSVSGLQGSYHEKLALLSLPSLHQRRIRGDMIQTFKMVKKIDNVDPNDFFLLASQNHQHATRLTSTFDDTCLEMLPSFGMTQRRSRLDLRKNFLKS